ncbi:MAG TPA: DUF1573 domain-containing protein [Bacteroidales bacterium]|nr:DUF1573 domain-containing protein [Bacteroidales bacterium]
MLKHNVLLITLIVFLASSCQNRPKASTDEKTKSEISFASTVHDFGTIPYDSDGRCYFEFTNTSDEPLVVNVVRTTCGCTRPEWPEEPVAPGDTGKIGITYNTKLPGNFQKSITVYSNASDSPVKLMIKGKVETEKKQENTN